MKAAAPSVADPIERTPEDRYLATARHRIVHLLRARAVLWLTTIAAGKRDTLWGLPQVSNGEVADMIKLPPLGGFLFL